MSDSEQRTKWRQTGYCLISISLGFVMMYVGASGIWGIPSSTVSFVVGYGSGALWMAGALLAWRHRRAPQTAARSGL